MGFVVTLFRIRWPSSVLFFLLTGLVLLLQLFPYTGIFLMFVGAAFWSVILVNLGFAGIAVEAVLGRVTRLWLIAPALWFGGAAAMHFASHAEFRRLEAELAARNAGTTLNIDPARRPIVLVETDWSVSASSIVQRYAVPAAYSAARGDATTESRLAPDAECRRISTDPAARAARINVHWFHEGDGRSRRLVQGLCVVTRPAAVPPQAIPVSVRREQVDSFVLPRTLRVVTAQPGDGAVVTRISATAQTFPLIPRPIMGCALNSARPAWQCFAGFARNGAQSVGGPAGTVESLLAAALSLEASAAPERRAAAAAHDFSQDQAEVVDRIARDNLAKVIQSFETPGARLTLHDVSTLRHRPDLYREHLEAIMTAIARRVAPPPQVVARSRDRSIAPVWHHPETARSLQLLLLGLPEEEGEPFLRRVMQTLDLLPDAHPTTAAPEFMLRISAFAADAVPLLEKFAFHGGRPNSVAAIQALCRIGRPAAHLAERLASELERKRTDSWSERRVAAYIAILRFGRPDIADRDSDQESRYLRPSYQRWRQGVTPLSDPAVCLE